MPLTLTVRYDYTAFAAAAAAISYVLNKRRDTLLALATGLIAKLFPAAPPPPTPKVNVAVIGCGGWTQGWHLPNLGNRNDCQVVAIVDPMHKPGLKGCMSHTDLLKDMDEVSVKMGAKYFRTLDEMLASKSLPKIDGVLCAAPHSSHCAIGLQALEAGLHVLMEKPMTTDVKEARQLLDKCRAKPQQGFFVNNTANWQPGALAAHEIVSSGRLGEIKHVSCVFAAPLAWLFEGEEVRPHLRPSYRRSAQTPTA
jgi:UDP-N-acetylglucosamine 3-dehydrogenase